MNGTFISCATTPSGPTSCTTRACAAASRSSGVPGPARTDAPAARSRCSAPAATSPVWNVRAPMIMTTFTEQLDFRGKIVVPFTTHAMSGLGTTARDYARSCRGATIAPGLAVRGEEVADADTELEKWLRDLQITR
ncbi:flavodoxin [Streptomyces sp. NPDC001536]|uniref:flavodoxin n=1 Tax=Streptomyces sp. NPDC001536 TaxID=3364583 RepID=UPI00367790F1